MIPTRALPPRRTVQTSQTPPSSITGTWRCKNRSRLLFLLTLIATTVLWGNNAFCQGTLTVIAVSGDPSPDGSGVFSSGLTGGVNPPPVFEPPTINALGQIAFGARIAADQDSFSGLSLQIFRNGIVELLARSGQPAPGGEVNFGTFEDGIGSLGTPPRIPAFNGQGLVVTGARLGGVPGLTLNAGLFKFDASGGLKLFNRQDPTPAGDGTYDSWSEVALNEAGQAALVIQVRTDPNNSFITVERLEVNNTFTRLIQGGETPVPGLGIKLTAAQPPAINAHGHVAFGGRWEMEGVNKTGVIVIDDEGPRIVAQSGDELPGLDASYRANASFSRPVFNDEGQIAFWVDLDAAVPSQRAAIILIDGDTTTILARAGHPTPDGLAQFAVPWWPNINSQGQVVFFTRAISSPPGSDFSGLYVGDHSGVRRIVSNGDPAPNGVGVFSLPATQTFGRHATVNDRGQIAFIGRYLTKRLIFLDEHGKGHQVMSQGDAFAGSTISDLYLYGDETFARERRFGGRSALNERGQVAYWAKMEDGREAILLWTPPASSPVLTISGHDENGLRLSILSTEGFVYQLRYNAGLHMDGWDDLGEPKAGNSTLLEFEIDATALGDAAFFLVHISEAPTQQ